MAEKYKNKIDQIHAPEALILKTQEKIRQKRRMRIVWRSVSAAAVLVLFMGVAFWYGQNRTFVNIQRVAFDNEIKVGVNAGTKGQEDDNADEDYLAVGDNRGKAQQIMEQITPSIIKGQKIYIGYEAKAETLYAVYQKGGRTYLIADDEKTEEEFISFLKKM